MSRKPLRPLTPDARRHTLAAMGLDEDGNPKPLPGAVGELQAAQSPGLPAETKEPEMTLHPGAVVKPLVPKWLIAAAAVVVPTLAYVAEVLPHPWGFVVGSFTFIVAYLAGLALPAPKWAEGKPVVPLTLVPMLAAAVPTLVALAERLEGTPRVAVYVLALACAGLAGKASPAPLVVTR